MRKSLPIVFLVVITLGAAILLNTGLQQYLSTPTPQIVVTTGSMIPTYNGYLNSENDIPFEIFGMEVPEHFLRGDLLLIKSVPVSDLKVGDVIVFEAGQEMPIVHRIVSIREDSNNSGSYEFLTKGDNNSKTDYTRFHWIPAENVIGKVVLRIPNIGWLSTQLQTTAGRVIIISLAGLLLVVSFFDEDEEEEDEKNEEKLAKNNNKAVNAGVKSRKLKIKNYFLKTKSGLTIISALSLILIFLVFNVATALNNPCDVSIMSMYSDDYPNLVDSQSNSIVENITYNSDVNDYLINIRYSISSGGFFNSINRIIVSTNTSSVIYVWNIVYQFSGTKVIKGVVPIQIDSSVAEIGININIEMQTSGLLSSGSLSKNFTMRFIQF